MSNKRGIMILCITAQGNTLEAPVEERFGRAPFFIIVDSETETFESVANPFAGGAGGIGPKAAQLIITHAASHLISGMVGGNARDVLIAAGVKIYTYRNAGNVKEALEQFKNGKLECSG